MTKQQRLREWALVVLLYLPVLAFYGAHFAAGLHDPDRQGTGFVQYDQPYYMANARQYLDGATDGLRYASPFSTKEHPTPIYFQPQLAVLALLWEFTGLDPGVVFVLFGIVFGLLCVRTCLRVLDHLLGPSRWRTLIAFLFLWGGGALFLLGLAFGLVKGDGLHDAFAGSFRFDPAGGWWFMNLGRNLVYPLEAYYHFLFFTIVLACLRRRFACAVLVSLVLAFSHPFTGVATLLMLLAWGCMERWYMRSAILPRWYLPALGSILMLAVIYYGVVLARDAEHAVLTQQWKIAWTEDAITFVPAYAFVGLFAFAYLRTPPRALAFLKAPTNRLLIVWALTWFALENHEFAVTPVQPLHFTRGYTWCALFLVGVPFLADALQWMRDHWNKGVATAVISVCSILFVLDNTVWMAMQTRANARGEGASIHTTRDQRALFAWLAREAPGNSLLVANDPMTAYLALVYTPQRAYYSHHYNTPYTERRYAALIAYFQGHVTDPLLQGPLLAVVYESNGPFVFADQAQWLYANASYTVYRMPGSVQLEP